MDYEKKYKDALKWMKKLYPTMTGATKEDAEHHFPELAESEDEKIRKVLIDYFKRYKEQEECGVKTFYGIPTDDILAWLEKQCGQNHVNIPKFHEGDWIVHHGTENIYQVVAIIDNQYQLKYGDNYTVQKCADVDKCARLWDITKDAKDGDVLADNGTKIIFIFKNTEYDSYIESKVIKYFIRYSFDGINLPLENGGHLGVVGEYSNFVPATKEQRDLLFQKMKEAGYNWDAEKRVLKKLAHQEVTKVSDQETSEWSEEDSRKIETLLSIIFDYAFYKDALDENKDLTGEYAELSDWLQFFPERFNLQPKQEWSKEDKARIKQLFGWLDTLKNYIHYDAYVSLALRRKRVDEVSGLEHWLKSLKERCNWKPSDEQMNALNYVVNLMASSESPKENDYYYNVFKDLKEQLKKLKEG